MGKIIDAIANDRLCVEPITFKGDPKFKQAKDRYCSYGEMLLEKLNEEEKILLQDYDFALNEERTLYGNDCFSKGFRLGVLIMTEVFTNEDDLIFHEEESV